MRLTFDERNELLSDGLWLGLHCEYDGLESVNGVDLQIDLGVGMVHTWSVSS